MDGQLVRYCSWLPPRPPRPWTTTASSSAASMRCRTAAWRPANSASEKRGYSCSLAMRFSSHLLVIECDGWWAIFPGRAAVNAVAIVRCQRQGTPLNVEDLHPAFAHAQAAGGVQGDGAR